MHNQYQTHVLLVTHGARSREDTSQDKHCAALAYAPEQVVGTLQAISAMLSMPITSDNFSEVILAACGSLFRMSPVTVHQRVPFLCQMYATGTHVARTAITTSVFVTPEPVMQTRAAKLQEQLGWDSEQLKQKVNALPSILNSEPSTLARNFHEVQGAFLKPKSGQYASCSQPY